MLKNNYLTFGNSIMQKYRGMTSRINPLALIFLQNEEEEEQQPLKPASITNVHNYFYRTNHYIYNNVVNRYVQNYNQIISLLQSNTLYAANPNFKLDIHPVQLNHTVVQTAEDMETVVKQTTERLLKEYVRVGQIQEKTTEVIIKQLTEGMSREPLKALPLKVREKVFLGIIKEVQERILPIVQKQTDSTVLTKETTKLLQQSVKTVIEQNTGGLPKPAAAEIAAKVTQELSVQLTEGLKSSREIVSVHMQTGQTIEKQSAVSRDVISNILIKQIEPYIMAVSPGTSRFVIRQEILKVCQKEETVRILAEELENDTRAVENKTNTEVIRETIQSLLQKIIEHTDTCRKGKEKFERQIVSRLTPLPVRPLNLEFRKEKEETEDAVQGQPAERQENRVIQQKVVRILKKEQTAESRYYTHFIEQFLKKTKEQTVTEADRSTLPAGIIYYQKPKETVRFVNQDVIKLPLEMLLQPQNGSIQAQAVTGQQGRQDGLIQQVKNEITNEVENRTIKEIVNRTANEIVNRTTKEIVNGTTKEVENRTANEIVNRTTKEIINRTTKEVVNKIENDTAEYMEYAGRRVVHRPLPEFTGQQSVADKGTTALYTTAENTVSYKNGTLTLTLLFQEEQEPVMNVADNTVMLHSSKVNAQSGMANAQSSMVNVQSSKVNAQSGMVNAQNGILYVQGGVPSGQGNAVHTQGNIPLVQESTADTVSQALEVVPVALIHKREESLNGEREEKSNSDSQGSGESIHQEQDIVFTKNIVTRQNINNMITEHINKHQEIMSAGQAFDVTAAGQAPAAGPGQAAGQQTGLMSSAKVEQMISESVSRHMDENINEISRQVYRTLERQIKKEQDRRGL